MADDSDPYANPDPYATPTAYNPSPVTDTVRALGNADPQSVTALLNERRQAFQKNEGERKKVEASQQLNVDEMSKLLDETAATIKRSREGRVNLPMLAMGAGMMTSTGGIGQQIGAGINAMVPQIQKGREEEDQTNLELAKLGLKKGELAAMPLRDKLAYIKAMQTGDINAMRALEVAQVRAQGTAAKQGKALQEYEEWKKSPGRENMSFDDYMQYKSDLQRKKASDLQLFDEWQKSPGNAGKSYEDYMKQKADLQQRKAAELQSYEEAKKADPNLTLDQYRQNKAEAEARGKAVGKSSGEASQQLGAYEANVQHIDDTINKLISHEGMKNAVGKAWGEVPAIPGTPKADFVALHNSLAGQVFLNAYQALRGAGAITEAEGLKATLAQVTLARDQSPEAYKAALREYQHRLKESVNIMRDRAANNQKPTPPGQTGQTPSGEIPEGTLADGPNGAVMIRKNGQWVPHG